MDLDPTIGVHSLFGIKAKNCHTFTFAKIIQIFPTLELSDNLHFQENVHS